MLVSVACKDLRVGMYVARIDGSWMRNPFWRSSFLINDRRQIERLIDFDILAVTIDLDRGLGPAVVPAPASSVAIEHVPSPTRERRAKPRKAPTELDSARMVVDRSRAEVMRLFEDARLGRVLSIDTVIPIIDDIAKSVEKDSAAILQITRLKTKTEYTYMHSVAVCALMINFGRHLGLPDSEVRDLGMAGLLHDVGKMMTPSDVLEKPGALTDEEFTQIRNHPVEGHALICDNPAINAAALDVCLHHHERIDGRGYPFGLVGEQLSLHARMGAICDVYDAITSHRPYKNPWSPNVALAAMLEWDGHFDPELLRVFIASVGISPVGGLVRLRSNRLAIVMGVRPDADPRMPDVRAFYAVEGAGFLAPIEVRTEDAGEEILQTEIGEHWFGAEWPHLRERLQAGAAIV